MIESVDSGARHQILVVCICTCGRNELLDELLIALEAQECPFGYVLEIVVVDNSPTFQSQELIAKHSAVASWVHEERRGIAEARNRSIDEALALGPDALVFIDDDERPSSGWLGALVEMAEEGQADVVTGPVEYELPAGADPRLQESPYFRRKCYATGATVTDVATNNTLVRGEWFRGEDPLRFREDFSLTGGSDKELFLRLIASGGECVWRDDAVVFEVVPPSRATWAWTRLRDMRNGQINARLEMLHNSRSRFRIAVLGVLRIIKGAAGVAFAFRRESRRVAISRVMVGVGWVRVAANRLYREYA